MTEEKTVLALGFFDGIHVGHGELLKMAKRRGEELNAMPAVLTFDAHPDTFVKKQKVELINSAEDRVTIIRRYYGIEDVFFIHFNELTMKMDWVDFIETILSTYHAVHFVVGHDFCFGYKGQGTALKLKAYCREKGIGCDIIPAVMRDGRIVSSTYIRELLQTGEMEKANALLGHPHQLTDRVRTGFRLGRTMEAPTVNMLFPGNVLVPRFGVYATKVLLGDEVFPAVTNIGVRPTFHGEGVTVETNILGFDRNIYGYSVCLEFYAFLRPEICFAGPQELMRQIREDSARAREILSC